MIYEPSQVPQGIDPKIARYLQTELRRIAASLVSVGVRHPLSVATAAEWQLDVTDFDINANVDISGNVRLENTNDVSLSSTDHALQIGDTSSTNLSFDPNEIQCRNNGSAAALAINSEGGPVRFGNTTPLTEFRADATSIDFNGDADISGTLTLSGDGSLYLKEKAAAAGDTAALGQIWVKSGTPNTLWFTDDAGTDHEIAFV